MGNMTFTQNAKQPMLRPAPRSRSNCAAIWTSGSCTDHVGVHCCRNWRATWIVILKHPQQYQHRISKWYMGLQSVVRQVRSGAPTFINDKRWNIYCNKSLLINFRRIFRVPLQRDLPAITSKKRFIDPPTLLLRRANKISNSLLSISSHTTVIMSLFCGLRCLSQQSAYLSFQRVRYDSLVRPPPCSRYD